MVDEARNTKELKLLAKMFSLILTESGSSSTVFDPVGVQLIVPVLDFEQIPSNIYGLLKEAPRDQILSLWYHFCCWDLVGVSKDQSVSGSKHFFYGSPYPFIVFLNMFFRVSLKILSEDPSLNWRISMETMLRMVLCKLSDPILISDACETLIYLFSVNGSVPGRPWKSLVRDSPHDFLPVVETILSYAETMFNKFSSDKQNLAGVTTAQLESLSNLIRVMQECILSVGKKSTFINPHMSMESLEIARLSSIKSSSALGSAEFTVVKDAATALLTGHNSKLLDPLPPTQLGFTSQLYVGPIAAAPDSLQYPTGSGPNTVEIRFRESNFAGIQNFNNTCYLSTFLQALFFTDGFNCSIYGFKLGRDEKTEEKDYAMGKSLVRNLQLLFARLSLTHHPYVEISGFITSLPPSYRSGEQQDVTESGRWIFDKIGGTSQSLVSSIFGGEMLHKTQCLGCNRISDRKEVFTDLGVSVPKESEVMGKKRVSVQSLIKVLLKPESLSGDNKYFCETCNKKQDAKRWIEIVRAPSHLMLVMHRFSFDVKTCDFKKEKTIVHPPYKNEPIDLVGNQFLLYGCIMHYGETATKGHYVCLMKRSSYADNAQARWTLLDDSHATEMSHEEAMAVISGADKPTNSAYVLLFKNVRAPRAVNPRMVAGCHKEALAIEAAAVHL